MNERIKELAEQAGLQQKTWRSLGRDLPMWQEDPDNPGLEKFAELIVADCINIVDGKSLLPLGIDAHVAEEPEDPIGKGWWRAQETHKRLLKTHFGVEK